MPDEDELAADLGELYAIPEVVKAERERLLGLTADFLLNAIKTARLIEHMPSTWRALSILADATVWLRQARGRMEKEISEQRPKAGPRGSRGGVG